MNPDNPSSFHHEPLIIDRVLGRGMAGDVYEVHSSGEATSRHFAVKRLRTTDLHQVEAFEREVHFLSKLSHPGLVPIHGFSKTDVLASATDGSGPCYWMDLIRGLPVLEAAPTETSVRIIEWLHQTLEALDYIHSQGVLHGDLKPANVLIDENGRARLLDFGLSALSGGGGKAPAGGTLPYLAPEALSGHKVPASDLYALGLVFHEALSGRHPREGAKSIREFFSAEFPRLEKNQKVDLSPRIKRIVDRMIEPDLQERFQSAADVLMALASEGDGRRTGEISLHSFRLFGREDEMSKARAFFKERQESDRSGVLLVHGATGVGKSRFVHELGFQLALDGIAFERVQETESLSPERKAELYRLLKEPEKASRRLLLEYNDDRLEAADSAFYETLLSSHPSKNFFDLALGNLQESTTGSFLEAVLKRPLPSGWKTEIYHRTRGNAELLIRTLGQLIDKGVMGKRHLSARQLETFLPRDFEDVFRQRVSKATPEEKCCLAFLAAAKESCSRERFLDVGRGPSLAICLDRLSALGLVSSVFGAETQYVLSNDSLRSIIADTMDLNPIHEAWISYWLERSEADQVLNLSHHALALPRHPQAVAWTLAAGELLRGRDEEAKAIASYELCLGKDPSLIQREALLRALANATGRAGDERRSLEWLERWFSEFPDDPKGLNPVKYWLATGVIHQSLGNGTEARRRLENCLNAGHEEDSEHRPRLARAHSLLGMAAIADRDLVRAKRHLETARRLVVPKSLQEAEIIKNQAQLAFSEGRKDTALSLFEESASLTGELGDIRGCFQTALERGNAFFGGRDADGAEKAYEEALRLAETTRDEALLARVHQNRGVLEGQKGNWASALDELEKAKELYVFFGGATERSLNLLQLAVAQAWVGKFETADALFQKACDIGGKSVATRAAEIVFELKTLREGRPPLLPRSSDSVRPAAAWDLEGRWLEIMTAGPEARAEELREILNNVHKQLPASLKITFEERPDVRRWLSGEGDIMKSDNLHRINAITSSLLNATNSDDVLRSIMDAAMELSRAERGILLLKQEDPDSPIPGFRVAVARNLSKNDLSRDQFRVSLSAVTEALQKGETTVTDNARQDTRFRDAPSVIDLNLKSILVLPLKTREGVQAALYLDHAYSEGVFKDADVEVLEIFAGQAGLALQKARMIEDLRVANQALTHTVSEQTTEIVILKKEVEEQRFELSRKYGAVIGQSPAMMEVLSLVDRLVDTSIPVWIFGESGTGKEMIARALHEKGPRAKKAFVTENCSSLPETLLESELFGHKKGAFTHADRDKKGLLQHADGGTVFLDEIADMSVAMQSKLLRFLQEGEIRPLGSNEILHVDVRVVSASNKDLQDLIAEGKFREDLFYRLNGMTVTLPPLRDRVEDIPILVRHFLEKFAAEQKRDGFEITPDALEILTDFSWPGNVRELENTIRSACLFHHKGRLTAQSFHFKKVLFRGASIPTSVKASPSRPSIKKKGMDSPAEEKILLLKALKENGYLKESAAQSLGISRRYLYTKLTQHGIPLNRPEMRAYVEKELG